MDEQNPESNILQRKIEELRMAPKHKREMVAFYITLILVSIIIVSWMAFVGGFSGYFSGNGNSENESAKNPFSIVADIFRDVEI